MIIRERNRDSQIDGSSGKKLDFDNKDLSTYIFLKTTPFYIKYSIQFFASVVEKETMMDIINGYLCFLENYESEKFNSLKTENGFDFEKVPSSMCDDFNEDVSKYSKVFKSVEAKQRAYYKEKYRDTDIKNPLDELLKKPFWKSFFQGLDFDYREQIFFITNVLNNQWEWLYPSKIKDEIKDLMFARLTHLEEREATQLSKHFNERLINLGFFSDSWETAYYVDSYFQGKNQAFEKANIEFDYELDSVDYDDVLNLNETELNLGEKVISKSMKNQESSYVLISGTNNYRLNNFTSYWASKKNLSLKNLVAKDFSGNQKELIFYIYAFARECALEKSVLFIDSNIVEHLIKKQEEKGLMSFLQSKNNGLESSFDILAKAKNPIVLLSEVDEKQKLIESLEERNINVLYSCKLQLPKENKYEYCAKRFFANNKQIPISILGTIVSTCEKNRIKPEEWIRVSKLFSHGENFSKDDVKALIHNMFNIKEKSEKKNTNYSFEALNTEPSIPEVLEMVKNVKKYEEDTGEKVGCLIKSFGPSGTGKTAFAKAIAENLEIPIKIVYSSDIFSPYSGETEQNIRKVFDEARETNCVLLFDEADSFLHSRGDSLNRHNDFKVNEFLTQMENYQGILFCNTNPPENFDKATDRRFNFCVEFKSLTKEGIDILCESYFKDYCITEKQKEDIFKSGEITPGDFGKLHKKMIFMAKEKINADLICQELITLGKEKKRSYENQNKIGFGI